MPNKPYSPAAEQNRDAILPVLQEVFATAQNLLEIGSGTGQHAVYFGQHLAHLNWQASDKEEHVAGIQLWIDEANNSNVPPAIVIDVSQQWPHRSFDSAFAANVAHIMHWHEIEAMFAGLATVLTPGAIFCLYGPFNINGRYTSESNREFDQWLQARDPHSCIRDKDDLNKLAKNNNFDLHKDWEMPCNNRILSWKKI